MTGEDRTECMPQRAVPNIRVSIEKAINGFVIKVGCQTFVATNWDDVSNGLKLYWENPKEAQEKFCK